jgi:flagellar basal-body rod protein FlgF
MGPGKVETDATVKVVSGSLEQSNVNMAGTMVDMIELAREFDVAVRMMRVADDNASRAASIASIS